MYRLGTVPAGPRSDFLFSQFEYLRKLGLPVQLKTGVIVVEVKHTVCSEGEQLNTNQAKLLELLDHMRHLRAAAG